VNLELEGRTALVTASTAGIGFAIARSLLGEGARVVVNGRSEETVSRAVEQLGGGEPLVADNGTAEGAAATFEAFPEVDILVNNLGIYEEADPLEETDEQWAHAFEVNVLSGVRLARHYLRGMLERDWGRVVFIASEAAVTPPPNMAAYSATKAMQVSASRSLAEVTKGSGVTVNAVRPGTTRAAGLDAKLRERYPGLPIEEASARFAREERPTSLIARLIEPREIGDFVAYVASPRASAINGAALRADGGIVRHML
jgi:3-oxoacyl-[acyl-carrier protein] reductase